MWRDATSAEPVFTDTLELDISSVEPSLAGPKRPQDRVLLSGVSAGYNNELADGYKKGAEAAKRVPVAGESFDIGHGDVVIAAITSCTNTSNPSVLIAAGLRSEEHTSELQSLMHTSYAVFRLKKKKKTQKKNTIKECAQHNQQHTKAV